MVGCLYAAVIFVCIYISATRYIPYNTSSSRDPNALNIHVVCHTHNDPGWLKTVDQYYYGDKQYIQYAGVQYILNSVVEMLLENPNRKFVYVEQAFFMRWWDEQDEDTKEKVHIVVDNGQLVFINGGYVMHDEAISHYSAMIDQTTLGHKFLFETFGVVPNIGWQIDPFGHSTTASGLLAAYLGFDAMMFARSDYQDLEFRSQRKGLEMIWRGSESLGSASEIFTHQFLAGGYGSPPSPRECEGVLAPFYDPYCPIIKYYDRKGYNGFDFETHDNPIMDDPELSDYDVEERVEKFVEYSMLMFNLSEGNDVMYTFGNDFNYQNAQIYYINLDKLINYVNKDGRLNMFYSTPHEYVKAKNSYTDKSDPTKKFAWPLKTDDFLPYADSFHAYWAGFFTSRAAFKGITRVASSYLNAARQLSVYSGLGAEKLLKLWEAVSLAQHHDALTGTERQIVSDDYVQRLAIGMAETEVGFNEALADLVQQHATTSPKTMKVDNVSFEQCQYLNASICAPSVTMSSKGEKGFIVTVYNSLAWHRQEWIRVPVADKGPYQVFDPDNKRVPYEVIPVASHTASLQQTMYKYELVKEDDGFASYEIVFKASIPPVGFSMYVVANGERNEEMSTEESVWLTKEEFLNQWPQEEDLVVSNSKLSLLYQRNSGLLNQVCDEDKNECMPVEHDMMYYVGSDGNETEYPGQASGAYVFRVKGGSTIQSCSYDTQLNSRLPVQMKVFDSDLVKEVIQTFSDWCILTTRLYRDEKFVEMEWTVGPLPFIEDGPFKGLGREVVSRFKTSLRTGGIFWTDANGRDMQMREINKRPSFQLHITDPIECNYYPITSAAEIRDLEDNRRLGIVTERGQGAASIYPGEVEVMLHRRTVKDDQRGVSENLNETMCGCRECDCVGLIVRGTHRLVFEHGEEHTVLRTNLQQRANDPPILLFSPLPKKSSYTDLEETRCDESKEIATEMSLVHAGYALPPSLHLVTLMPWEEGKVLVRVAHLYEVDTTQQFSKEVTFEVTSLLSKFFRIKNIYPVSLTANQSQKDLKKNRMSWRSQEIPFYNAYNQNEEFQTSFVNTGFAQTINEADISKEYNEPWQLRRLKQFSNDQFTSSGQDLIPLRSVARDKIAPMEVKTYIVEVERRNN